MKMKKPVKIQKFLFFEEDVANNMVIDGVQNAQTATDQLLAEYFVALILFFNKRNQWKVYS